MACCCCPCFGGKNERTVCWKFHLTINSAENLPNVRRLFPTRAYAKIYVGSSDGETTKHRTNSDDNNGLNPSWNYPIAYETTESGVLYYGVTVTIKLYTKRSLGRDRYIGEVQQMMKDLFEGKSCDGSARLSLPVMRGSIGARGILNICYSFEEGPEVLKSHFKRRKGRGTVASFTKNAIYFAILALTS